MYTGMIFSAARKKPKFFVDERVHPQVRPLRRHLCQHLCQICDESFEVFWSADAF